MPSGERWIHEIKFDGYRVQLHIHNDTIKVFTWRGNDWTKRFRKIADDANLINAGSAVIDGEEVVPAENGTIDFSVLQNELKGKSAWRASRRILGEYIAPGPRDPTQTVERLLAVLDRDDVIHAMDRMNKRRVIRLVE